MQEDTLVEVSWSCPPEVACPAHQELLRAALLNNAQDESTWCKLWHKAAAKMGDYRKGIYAFGGMFALVLTLETLGEVGNVAMGTLQQPSTVASAIVASIDDLEVEDKRFLEERTGLDLEKVKREIASAEDVHLSGSHVMSPQLVWDTVHDERGDDVIFGSTASLSGQEEVMGADESLSKGVKMLFVDYSYKGEQKRMGLTVGYVPLVIW